MNNVIPILRDIVLEAQTTSRDLEFDDPVVESLDYIENMTKRAIEKLGGEV
jgi:hypothetical protein